MSRVHAASSPAPFGHAFNVCNSTHKIKFFLLDILLKKIRRCTQVAAWATPVFASFARMSLSMRRSLAYRLREAGVTESAARILARQPAPVPEDPDRAFDAPKSD